MAVARDADRLASLAAEADAIEPFVVGLETQEGCAAAIAAARRLGPIGVLVNNAGRGGWHDRPIWEQDRAGWDASMAVNLHAPFELTRQAAADMRAARWGRIVMISSTAGEVGAASNGPYCASKHGVIGLMRSVAQDVASYGVTCNAVLPGWVRTEMADEDAAREAAARGLDTDAVWAERSAAYPSGRVVDVREVAAVVAFLAGESAAGVNGEAITVAHGSHW